MKISFGLCRKSLTTIICATAAIAILVTPEMASAKQNKKIGIQLYSVMDAMKKNPQASIERLAGMGY